MDSRDRCRTFKYGSGAEGLLLWCRFLLVNQRIVDRELKHLSSEVYQPDCVSSGERTHCGRTCVRSVNRLKAVLGSVKACSSFRQHVYFR